MFERFKFWLILLIALLLLIYTVPAQSITNYVSYAFSSKNGLNLNISLVNPEVKMLAADPANQLILKVEVRNATGAPVPKAHVVFTTSGNMGQVYPSSIRTDKNGESLVSYIPPASSGETLKNGNTPITIRANIYGTKISSSVQVELTKVPVIFLHGYNAAGYIFDNMKEYLSGFGYEGSALEYKSQDGIVVSSKELSSFLQEQKILYLNKGIQVKKFDLVAHSMGGLVARYYTCSEEYIKNNDVRKLIFISVPHRGSLWASIGAGYYNDQGVRDLIPDNPLLSKTLPAMLNKGLNHMIQVGSILGQYDEVVTPESANLDQWNIKTEVYNVGENNLTMGNLLSGNLLQTANHGTILNNKKVFERIASMLGEDLPYPAIKK